MIGNVFSNIRFLHGLRRIILKKCPRNPMIRTAGISKDSLSMLFLHKSLDLLRNIGVLHYACEVLGTCSVREDRNNCTGVS